MLPSRFDRANVCRIPEAQAVLVPRQCRGHAARFNRNAPSRVCCGRLGALCSAPVQGSKDLGCTSIQDRSAQKCGLFGCGSAKRQPRWLLFVVPPPQPANVRPNASTFRLRLLCAITTSPAYGRRRRGRRSHTGDTPGATGSPLP